MEMAECVIADVIFSLPQCLNFSSLFIINKLQQGATENNLDPKRQNMIIIITMERIYE